MYDARGTDAPWYQARDLSEDERAAFRATTLASQQAKRQALSGEGPSSKHPINKPRLSAKKLMPMQRRNGMTALSLFSGGGGMDIGFDRAGFDHAASYEILEPAGVVLRAAHPRRAVFSGAAGDVTRVDWRRYRDTVDVLHGGPPCQPFSHAGRRQGSEDARDMIPEFVRAVRSVRPRAFVCENVSGLLTKRFADYVQATILAPLSSEYTIACFHLDAADFGVPQRRKRVFFVGFRERQMAERFVRPQPTHSAGHFTGGPRHPNLPGTMGARAALGLVDIGVDELAPTIRSGLTGPRHTTSILNSVTAQRVWHSLGIWPNGVALTRELASSYVAKHDHFRLSVPDCMVLQGFPEDWPITKPVYMALGLIGNSVAPPMAYRLARSLAQALR